MKINRAVAKIKQTRNQIYWKFVLAGGHLKNFFKRLSLRNFLISGLTFCSLFLLVYTVQFYWPRTIRFSYAGISCSTSPVLLPELVSKHDSRGFQVHLPSSMSIGKYSLYSHQTCASPTQAPSETASETVQLSQFGSSYLKKQIRVAPGKIPSLANLSVLEKPLPARSPLILTLESPDNTFDYRLLANDKEIDCIKDVANLQCDMTGLGLAQATKYDLALQRSFDDEVVGEVFKKSITTVEPVRIVSSSISAGQMVFDIPTEITLTLDKTITSFAGAKVTLIAGETKTDVPVQASLGDKVIKLTLKEPLPRSASLILSLDDAVAPDGGHLFEPLSLSFQTSGGPKVVRASIGTYKVAVGGNIVLTFDSTISATQAVDSFVYLETGSGRVAATVTKSGKTVIINPQADLPKCTAFTVKVLDGIQNEFGIAGGSAWQLKSRTICQTVFGIGTSVQGRYITGYSFGSGPSKIIYVGTLHGNEKSATSLLNSWVDALEAGADRIPANRTIIVIPNLNPDGYAANQRTNANNVDLNRNFPSNDWKSGVSMPDGSFLATGGGSAPLSEPETSAIANYISSQGARLVLTYHAAGAVVSPNDSGDSQAIASAYAQKSPVGYLSNAGTASFFAYDTTGALESWLHDKKDIATLLIELTSKTGNPFSGHSNALWYTATLP